MIDSRTLAVCVIGVVFSAHGAGAQGQARYRDFLLGADLASVATVVDVAASEAKVIHERPSLLQELQWRPPYWISGTSQRQTDPVQLIAFRFYDNQLFRLVIDYDRQRTDGMTDADMIEAISATYGPQLSAKSRTTVPASQIDNESGPSIARWGNADYSVVLHRSTYASAFRLVVTSPRLDALARTAAAQALRLEAREAPQREVARQQKEEDDNRALQEKAREANKAVFRP
jgi:hypothetical protein